MTTADLRECLKGCLTSGPLRRGLCDACYKSLRVSGGVEPQQDARFAQAKIKYLIDAGWAYNAIARAAGLDKTVVHYIAHGKRSTLLEKTHRAIMHIDVTARDRYMVSHSQACVPGCKCNRHDARSDGAKCPQGCRCAKHTALPPKVKLALATEPEPILEVLRGRPMTDADAVTRTCLQDRDLPADWRDMAPCAQTDPEVFFPEKGGTTRPAKAICKKCDFRQPCLEWAMSKPEKFGVWGGLSESERRKLERERQQQPQEGVA